jgi:hypothetical protein
MKNKILILAALVLFVFTACETFDLDQTNDPNAITEDQSDPEFAFNTIQLNFVGFAQSINDGIASDLARQTAMNGSATYQGNYAQQFMNNIWASGYILLNNIKSMTPKASAKNMTYHLGASKIMESFIMTSLVDLFGDVPYSEALQGNTNLSPKFDKSADVYKKALLKLDEAIADLQKTPSLFPINDLYYPNTAGGGNSSTKTKWITLAKTLKLRLFNNARLNGTALGLDITTEINSLLTQNDLIDTPAEDFQFQYNNIRLNPNTRHPLYTRFYENATTIGGNYLGNYMMWTLGTEKGITDPRKLFYFNRQDNNTVGETTFTLSCPFEARPNHYNSTAFNSLYVSSIQTPFCTNTTTGYWGRDHGDAAGIPPDNAKRTVPGVYPAGGAYDDNIEGSTQNNGTDGELGKGITPILLSSYVNFIKAEAILALGVTGNAKLELENGIRASIDKSTNFIKPASQYITTAVRAQQLAANPNATETQIATATATAITSFNTSITSYVDFVLNFYDANPTLQAEVVAKEYYIAAFGNGLEVYNTYRRTGFPSNMQPSRSPSPGVFFNTALYPANSTANNPNTPSPDRSRKVFWHTSNVNLN